MTLALSETSLKIQAFYQKFVTRLNDMHDANVLFEDIFTYSLEKNWIIIYNHSMYIWWCYYDLRLLIFLCTTRMTTYLIFYFLVSWCDFQNHTMHTFTFIFQISAPCRLMAPCYGSICVQKYAYHRLLSFDPCQQEKGLFIDVYRLPVACSCATYQN